MRGELIKISLAIAKEPLDLGNHPWFLTLKQTTHPIMCFLLGAHDTTTAMYGLVPPKL